MMSRQTDSTSIEPPAHSKVADSAIRHVSDTALWVATFRAEEGHRASAAFDDPLASILAGERGRAIARSISRATIFDNAGQRRLPRGWAAKLKEAPILFKATDWFGFFEQYGWRSSRVITSLEESQRIKRPYPIDFPLGLLLRVLPNAMRQKIQSLTGAVLMQSTAGPSAQQSRRQANGNATSQVKPCTP